jgi:hypothetical protein
MIFMHKDNTNMDYNLHFAVLQDLQMKHLVTINAILVQMAGEEMQMKGLSFVEEQSNLLPQENFWLAIICY